MKKVFLGVLFGVPLAVSAANVYVWPGSPAPAVPFDSWNSAAHTIQEAIDAAQAGDTVLVTNGVYSTGTHIDAGHPNRVSIYKAVRVESANGPKVTYIVGNSGAAPVRCAYVGPGAILSGFTLTNGLASGSSAPAVFGGGSYAEPGGTVSNCVAVGNRAMGDGGGMYGGTVRNCLVSGNSAGDDGGGVDGAVIYNSIISNNTAGDDGGGVDDSTIYNSVVRDNSANEQGGGAYESSAFNCTFTGNSARRGGGMCGRLPDQMIYHAQNCIIYHNRGAAGPNHFAMNISYSCTTPLPLVGPGNIDTDPLLGSDYHLSTQSRCIGAGINPHMGTDIDGQPWGNPPCIGADQLTPGTAIGELSVALQIAYTNVAVGYSVAMNAEISGQTLGNRWAFGDGVALNNRLEATHVWSAPGTYDVILTAFNDEFPGGVSSTVRVQVVEAPVAYVNGANLAPVFPYSTWGTAATSIQDAIGAGAIAGRAVWVTNGTYNTGGVAVHGALVSRVALTNAVIVQSVNGPGATVIARRPGEAARCAFVGAGSLLSGFTLTNGMTLSVGDLSREQGGGGAWCERGGVVSNCWILGNVAMRDGGGIHGGTAIDCLVAGNRANDDGGGADSARLIRCVVQENASGDAGGGADESWLEWCTLIANSAPGGAGVDDATVIDCTLTGHTLQSSVGSDAVFVGCNIVSNSAYSAVTRSMVDRTIFRRNISPGSGAGASHSVLANCLLTWNVATNQGGGLYHSLAYNCTVALNESDDGAVAESTLQNSIVYFNEGGNHFRSVLSNSCTIPLPGFPSWGNITNDPCFVALLGDNFRLRLDSPCIDRAAYPEVSSPIDLDGNPRFFQGGATPPRADLGAYEFQPLRFTAVYRQGAHIVLVWTKAPRLTLEASPALEPHSWSAVPEAVGQTRLEVAASGPSRFFRLVQQTTP